jgi:putative transposase
VRHQLHVLERTRSRRVRLSTLDRWLWVWLSSGLAGLAANAGHRGAGDRIAWHRRGLRLFWTWKSRHRTGRPPVPREVRDLIRTMSHANPLWGAPRIHGELLKVGIDVSQATVAKYMIRHRRRHPKPGRHS